MREVKTSAKGGKREMYDTGKCREVNEWRRWCMKGDESANPPHPNNAPVPGNPLWPSQSTAFADHSYTHTHIYSSEVRASIAPLHALFEIQLQTMSSHHMLSRGFERKSTCMLCIHLREACVCHPPYRGTSEGTDRCSMRLSTSLGWWSREIKGL